MNRLEYMEWELESLKKALDVEKKEESFRSVFSDQNKWDYAVETGVCLVPPGNTTVFAQKNIARQVILDSLKEVMEDVMKVFDFGAQKHPDNTEMPNFLLPSGNKCSLRDRGSSILRHAARVFMNPKMLDEESGLSELLHLLASAAIVYIRNKREIVHPNDEV